MAQVYDVFTNLDPQQLTTVASEIYYKWLLFAVGQEEIGGKKLIHPSGRYAASLSWKKTGAARVSIIADEKIANEALFIEEGRGSFSLKDKMLVAGRAGVHRSKAGYLYRVLGLRPDQWRNPPSIGMNDLIDTPQGTRMRTSTARIWAAPRPHVDPRSRGPFTMSQRPGTSPWVIPSMPVYAPAAILAAEIKRRYGRP